MRRIIVSLFIVSGIPTIFGGAASLVMAAPSSVFREQSRGGTVHSPRTPDTSGSVPRQVSFRDARDRGLLVSVWVNDAGPYTFAVDTGAGINLVSNRLAARAGLTGSGAEVTLGGISGVSSTRGSSTTLRSIAIGDPDNLLRANQHAIIIGNMPEGIDGVLDPTEAYSPFGFSIDLPNRELSAFDPRRNPLTTNVVPEGGTVVRWLGNGSSRRPFVRLGDGRLALLDTGSRLGLAISEGGPASGSRGRSGLRDLGGGRVESERVAPSTISIGSMTLRRIPTDLLRGAEADAPILLGRDALYPFRLTFDPVQRLIEIAPVR